MRYHKINAATSGRSFLRRERILQLMLPVLIMACGRSGDDNLRRELESIDLIRGEVTLCRSAGDGFGSVSFAQGCSEELKPDFELAVALLHAFEYAEAEKVFVRIIDRDPRCIMGYWGAAMCNFHPLWAPPNPAELEKGSKIIALARSVLRDSTSREAAYLEAVASIFDDWQVLDYRTRVLKFEAASRDIVDKYPDDEEAAVFYALSLEASADPADKTFRNQRRAGEILNAIFEKKPDHPGIAHYIIHNYDYPELATLALSSARKYASIAPASAHAQHMPSHIFTRLGLWDESIQSNLNSVASAQCYAQGSGMRGHWDEELHGLDYLLYAYLQKGEDDKALEQINYLKTIDEVFPISFKCAYAFAAMPARYALETKNWTLATELQHTPAGFPWQHFPWESANIHFARLLGFVRVGKRDAALNELAELEQIHLALAEKDRYKGNLVAIQVKVSTGWIALMERRIADAVGLMREAADMEDATAKHPVTPGEIIPARELLADMLVECRDYTAALAEYEKTLATHPWRLNALYGAALASARARNAGKSGEYVNQLRTLTRSQTSERVRKLIEQI